MKRILLLSFFLYSLTCLIASNITVKYSLSGYVRDAVNGEVILGATVYVRELQAGASSNAYGYYALNLPKGSYTVDFSYLGYVTQTKKIRLDKEETLNIDLSAQNRELKEVVVRGERKDANVTRNLMSTQKIEIGTIRKMPALMGEVDLLKAIQLLPGVVSAGEGTSSFSVRGGAIDQNLIVLDEATVYNASHLMGFFSVFNNDAIKNLTLYKGDIPAVYDGRLASLLEVNMKDGNNKRFSGSGGIGTISSRLTLEGPIVKDKTSFIISARRTYADLFLKLSSDEKIRDNRLYFYDLNAKLNHQIDNRNRIFISAYVGQDVFSNNSAGFNFGNTTVSGRWNHLFSRSLFSNLTISYSTYSYGLESDFANESNILWRYKMQDVAIKYDFTYFTNPQHTLKFGYHSIFHKLSPGDVISSGGSSSFPRYVLPSNYSLEQGIYGQSEHQFSDRFSLKLGIRLNAFSNIGSGTIYSFDQNYNSVDSTVYGAGEFIKTFLRFAPRIGINYKLNDLSSLKASYSRTNQFLQMASNSTAGTPLDLWFTAGPNVAPQTCDQFAVGFFVIS